MAVSNHTLTSTDGATLHYTIHSPLPPSPVPSHPIPTLIFLHYYGGSPSTFSSLLSYPSLSSFPKVLYHARGWAPSTGPSDQSAYGVKSMASDLAAIIDATGIGHSASGFVLVGHSMGGKVAQYYAATSSSPKLRGLFLIAPAPLRGLKLPPEAKEKQRQAYQSADGVRFVVDNVLTAGPGRLKENIVDQVVRDSMRGNEYATAAWPTYACEEDYGELVDRIKVPVAVLRGDKDFERELVGELGSEKGWENRLLEDCGHLIPLERPVVLIEEVLRFVKRIME